MTETKSEYLTINDVLALRAAEARAAALERLRLALMACKEAGATLADVDAALSKVYPFVAPLDPLPAAA